MATGCGSPPVASSTRSSLHCCIIQKQSFDSRISLLFVIHTSIIASKEGRMLSKEAISCRGLDVR